MRGMWATLAALTALAVGVGPAGAQPAVPADAPADAEAEAQARAEALIGDLLAAAEVPGETRPLLRLLATGDVDPAVALWLTTVLEDAGVDEAVLQALAAGAMGGNADPSRPAMAALGDGAVVIVDGGVLYRIDTGAMRLEGRRVLRPRCDTGVIAMFAAIRQTGQQAREAARRGHLITLRNAVDLYHHDVGAWPPTLGALVGDTGPEGYQGPYLATIPDHPFGRDWGYDPGTGALEPID
jgi:hypothetical protein